MVDEFVPVPTQGRVFSGGRTVRLGDVNPTGRVRLDALARYLQDVAYDDTRDAGMDPDLGWVVRRTVIDVIRWPTFGEWLELQTFCSGVGSRWTERRVSLRGEQGGVVEAATTWVLIDLTTGQPKRLPPEFHELFAPTAAGRAVRARLYHPDPVADAQVRPWHRRNVDFDAYGHMNNAMYWALLEEGLDQTEEVAPVRGVVEFRREILPNEQVLQRWVSSENGQTMWLTSDVGVHASGSWSALTQ
jgi:acyl-ACP thioesterase